METHRSPKMGRKAISIGGPFSGPPSTNIRSLSPLPGKAFKGSKGTFMVEALIWSVAFFLLFMALMEGVKKTHERIQKRERDFREQWRKLP